MTATTLPRRDNVPLAVGTVVFTVLALSLGDALIKGISADLPLWQIFVLRSLLVVPVLVLAIKLARRGLALVPRRVGWTLLRSLLLTAMWVAYYASLTQIALSVAAAVYYTLPLFIVLFAGLLLGERVDPRGWFAVLLGFAGVLLILRPQASDFNAFALLPLLSAVCYAFAMILTRSKCQTEHPLVLSLALNLTFIAVGGLASLAILLGAPASDGSPSATFLLAGWIAMGPQEWLAMALLAAAILIGSVGAAIAYQLAPASIVATFDFSYLAFAALWGLLFFAEVPDAITILGMALIAVAGIIAVRKKSQGASS